MTTAFARQVALVSVAASFGDRWDWLIGPREPAERVVEAAGPREAHDRGAEMRAERATQMRHIAPRELGEVRAARRTTTRFSDPRANPREPKRNCVWW